MGDVGGTIRIFGRILIWGKKRKLRTGYTFLDAYYSSWAFLCILIALEWKLRLQFNKISWKHKAWYPISGAIENIISRSHCHMKLLAAATSLFQLLNCPKILYATSDSHRLFMRSLFVLKEFRKRKLTGSSFVFMESMPYFINVYF